MGDIRDIGRQAVEEIASLWQVDRSRSVRTENGFEWWPGDFRVAVMAHDGFDVHPDSCLLRVRTDFLQDIPINDDGFVRLAAATSRFCAPTYAWAYPPPELWDKYAKGEDRPELLSIYTADLTRAYASWLAQFLAQMSIMQPINAQLQAAGLGEVLCGGIPHISQPAGA